MNIYVDDNTSKAVLVALLRKAGHQVTVPADIGTVGIADARYFVYAIEHSLVVLTKDHYDFEDLHFVVQASQGQHAGVLAIRQDNDASRDMKDRDIIRALAKLERAGIAIPNEFIALNHWR